MSFFRKRKKDKTEKKNAPVKQLKKNTTIKRKKIQTATRDEFRAAAMKRFNAAASSSDGKSVTKAASKRAANKPQKKKKHILFRILIIIVSVIILCLAGLYIYSCVTVPTDTIGRNVYIENTNVSNLSTEEALKKLDGTDLLGGKSIVLSCNLQTFTMNCAEAGLTAKPEETVNKAMRYGKSGNILYDGFCNMIMLFIPHTTVPDTDVDKERLCGKIAEFGNIIYGELTEHSMDLGDNVIVCSPGHSGFDNNTETAYKQIVSAMERDQLGIPVSLNAGEPKTLTVNDVNNFTYREPENAYYQKQGNEITVAPEVYGRYLDMDEAEQLLSELHEGGDAVEIPYYVSEPEITAQQLSEKLFDSVIASYSTSYGTSPVNRCANIANAASKINGKTLMPSDVFSFNEVVGPRSAANGFYSAKEYVSGETVDGIGGGTCQVSSTLYNAVLYSDLSIVTRTNHMFPVEYCPIGQDATVADSGIDFKFVNSMNYPIKISAVTEGYTITVSIIGTERDDPRTVDIENTVTQSGSDKSVHSVRYVYNSSGELIQSDDLGNSYYMAHNQ